MDKVRGLFKRKRKSRSGDVNHFARFSSASSARHSLSALPESTTTRDEVIGDSGADTTTTIVVGGTGMKASVRRDHSGDAEVVAALDSSYFDADYNCLSSVLNTLPSLESLEQMAAESDAMGGAMQSPMTSASHLPTDSKMDDSILVGGDAKSHWKTTVSGGDLQSIPLVFLESESAKLKEWQSAVERSFKKKLLDNSHKFLEGMRQIREVQLDLRITESRCAASRSTLASVKQSLVSDCFSVICTEQRRARRSTLVALLREVNELLGAEKSLKLRLEQCRFVECIELHQRITASLTTLKGLTALDKMRQRFRGGASMITEQLDIKLKEIIEAAPALDSEMLNAIFECYFRLDEMRLLNEILERTMCSSLQTICTRVICKQLKYSEKFTREKEKQSQNYKKLCRSLKVGLFMKCFMEICGRVFDMLHCYYRIESLLIKFRNTKGTPPENMQLLRKALWVKTQALLGDLLESSEFTMKSKIKMEDLLLTLHGAEVFRTIGKAFSGSESKDLEKSIRTKCKQYLDHFRREFFESLKTTFDNEMWVVLPMPDGFGVHSIKELRRNPHVLLSFKTIDATMAGRSSLSAPMEEVKSDDGSDSKTESSDATSVDSEAKDSTTTIERKSDYLSVPLSKRMSLGTASQPEVYQKFLAGENLFDMLMQAKMESEAQASRADVLFDTSPVVIRSDRGEDESVPVLTSASLNLVKHMGRCLHIMECLDPVSYEAFCALRDSFHFYLYHVFVWFGVNVSNFFQETHRFKALMDSSSAGGGDGGSDSATTWPKPAAAHKKYPKLCDAINAVNEAICSRSLAPELDEMVKKKASQLGRGIRKPSQVPDSARVLMETSPDLSLHGEATMRGAAARFVAAETLVFLVHVIKAVSPRICHHLPESRVNEAKELLETSKAVVEEFRRYMYRNVPVLLVNLGSESDRGSLISQIGRVNWNKHLISEHCNAYVPELVRLFVRIQDVLLKHTALPTFIHHRLNREAIIYVMEQLVVAYAKAQRCSTEGRALMALDLSELRKALTRLRNTTPMPPFDYTTGFVQAFYLAEDELLEWVRQKPEYPLKVVQSFARVGKAAESCSRKKERQALEQKITKAHSEAESQQKQLDQM